MTTPYLFREANIDDLSSILNWTESLMDHEALDSIIELELSTDIAIELKTWLTNLIDDDNTLIVIAINELTKSPVGIIIGYLQSQPNKFTIYEVHGVIQMVWVDLEQRQQGLAAKLVNAIEETFVNLDIPYCEIQYSQSNTEAAAFWEKVGFQVVNHTSRKFYNK